MQKDKIAFRITPAACICLAISSILLPLDWLISWLLALMIHELSHIAAVRICGARVHHICFSLTGAKIVSDGMTNGKELICALAGPAGGLLLLPASRWLPLLVICGCLQSAYNLLPLKNLDGGHALFCILCLLRREQTAQNICARIDLIMRVLLCVLGFYAAWRMSWGVMAAMGCVFLLRGIHNKNSLQTERTTGTIALTE